MHWARDITTTTKFMQHMTLAHPCIFSGNNLSRRSIFALLTKCALNIKIFFALHTRLFVFWLTVVGAYVSDYGAGGGVKAVDVCTVYCLDVFSARFA